MAGSRDRGEENDPIFGRGFRLQSAQGKVLGNGEEPGPSSWWGVGTTALWTGRKLRSGLRVSRLGGPKGHSPSLGPGILLYKSRLGPLEETFLPKAVVLGHA